MFAFARRCSALPRTARRLALVSLASIVLGAALIATSGGPAAAQQPAKTAEIDGNANFKWNPAQVNVAVGAVVTFKVSGGPPHPVGSGTGPQAKDNRFDDSGCGFDKMSKVGDSCKVTFNKAGTYPYFCEVHFASGMTGVITVGSGGGGGAAPATTAGATPPVVSAPAAAPGSTPGKPGVYWLGYGLLALGALLALAGLVGYLRFAPGFRRGR